MVEVVLIYEKTKTNTFGFVGSAAQALEYIDLLAATCFEENVEIFQPTNLILSQAVLHKKTKMLCKRRQSKVQILRRRKRITYERSHI